MHTSNNKDVYFATAKEMEMLDAQAVDSGLEIRQMMELAGWHMLTVFRKLEIPSGAKGVIVCGRGNKGGDGLSAARHLINHGWQMTVILLDKEISQDSQHHLGLLEKMRASILYWGQEVGVAEQEIQNADILIDALIGYHLEGAPRGLFQEAINAMNKNGKRIIAYDIPSGMDASTGECLNPCIEASATLSLALPKRAFLSADTKSHSGRVFVADIGIPDFLYDTISVGSRPHFEGSADFILEL